MQNKVDFINQLNTCAKAVEAQMGALLKAQKTAAHQEANPKNLIDAMLYATLNGGKRIRPFLMIETAKIFGNETQGVYRAAAAIEMLHSYSLVHDDLPAMDDDELRRGKPTTHIAYDEATAILTGDALLTFAFEILGDEQTHKDPSIRIALVACLTKAAGPLGMVGGQMLDMEAENQYRTETQIKNLQAMKTGALLTAAVEMGTILGGADEQEKNQLIQYGQTIGLTFQLADDLLDITATSTDLGKTAGKDAQSGKATLISLQGIEQTKVQIADQVKKAKTLLDPFGGKAKTLIETTTFIAERSS